MARGIELLHPELQVIAYKFVESCKAAGLNVLITETFRTAAEQDALYAQGRTKPGSIVTNCKGGDYQSAHQWGVAFDICRNVKGQEYADSDGFFAKCGTVGKKLGLVWGGDWKGFVDKPHFELAKYLPNNSTATLKKQYGTPEGFKKTWSAAVVSAKEDDEVLSTMNVQVNGGEIKTIGSILKDGQNYPNLRELAALTGYGVGYEAESKAVKLERLPDSAKMLVNGESVDVERVLINGVNYVKLRELEKMGIDVDYDEGMGVPVLTLK